MRTTRDEGERVKMLARSGAFALALLLALGTARAADGATVPGVVGPPVLALQPANNVADALLEHPELGTFAVLVEQAGLLERLRKPGHVTLFAPTDSAFEPYRDGRLERLREQPQQLERFVRNHMIENDIIIIDGGRLTDNGSLNPIDDVLLWPE